MTGVAKPNTELPRFSFCLGCKNDKGGCGGGSWGGPYMVIVVVGVCDSAGDCETRLGV
jgi:hypothetical protein